ncbi:MAG: D-arabinono-1,4-lactone oxidase, partial [Cyclobacteriaceae bacterium]
MFFSRIIGFFLKLFISSEEGKVTRLITRLQQDSCDDQVQKELYEALDKSPEAVEKQVPEAVGLEYAHVDQVLSMELIPKTVEERNTLRTQRQEIRQDKRLAKRDRRLARKEARERRREDREEAKNEKREKKHTGKRFVWQNAIKSQTVQPLKIFFPESLEDIIDIVEEADELGLKVRAVGSGHSASDVAVTSDYLMYTHGIDEALPLNKNVLKEEVRSLCLFEAESGMTVRELNGELEDVGYALPNAGGSDVQTIMGAVSTSTHGSGISLGAYPDLIRSFVLVTTEGQVYRVEPKDGITDPALYNEADIPLIQDDEWFYATLVSMGSMGVVYSVIMEVKPLYWLEEKRKVYKWGEVRPMLEEGSLIRDNEHIEVYLNPYKTDGDHTCVVTTRNTVVVNQRPKGPDGRRNFLSSLVMCFKVTPKILLQMFMLIPHKTPSFIDRAMKALEDEEYINKSYKVLNQGLKQVKTVGTAIEVGFSMDNYLAAVDKIFEIAEERALIGCQYVTSPFALRFVKESRAYLSMMYGRDTCMIEIPTLTKSLGRVDILHHFQGEMYKCGGRPHWGLELDHLTG